MSMSPALLLASVSLALFALVHLALWKKLAMPSAAVGPRPPISVLKPLRGVDEGLFENLSSLARQRYPSFELVLGAESPDDPALEVARALQRAFPQVAIQVVAGCAPLGMNPKVTLLAALSARARHDHWLISDSNVRAPADYLEQMAAALGGEDVGLVHSLVAGAGEASFGALLENLHLATFVAPVVSAAELIANVPTVVGKSMLFHQSTLAEVGGWWSVRDVLAEDYLLGRAIEAAGFCVVASAQPVETINGHWSLERFLERHVRWGQMRRRISPWHFLGEPLLLPTPWLLLLALLAPGQRPLALAGLGLQWAIAFVSLWRLRGAPPSTRLLLALPVKDLAILASWPIAAFKRTVCWRGHRARIGAGSLLRPVEQAGALQPAQEVA